MKTINKVLIGIGIVLLIVIIYLYILGLLLSPSVEPLRFSIHNMDVENHRVTVEILDSTNKSLFNKTYMMNPRESEYYPDITEKKGDYTFKVTLDNKFEKTYRTEVGVFKSGVSIWLYGYAMPESEYPISIRQAVY